MSFRIEKRYPDEGDIIMSEIKEIDEYGVVCLLLEYGGIEARLNANQVSKRRIKSLKTHLRIGEQLPLEVISVDEANNYIDLSKKTLIKKDTELAMELYHQNKFVHNILSSMTHKIEGSVSIEYLYETICWPITRNYSSAYIAFETISKDLDLLNDYSIREDLKDCLGKILIQKFKPKVSKVETEVHVTCFGADGIDAVKESLRAGLKRSTDEFPIDISVVSCPSYSISTKSYDQNKAITFLKEVLKEVESKILTYDNGGFKVKRKPMVI